MKRSFFSLTGVCLTAALCFTSTLPVAAQSKAPKQKRGLNVQGTVQAIEKPAMKITVTNLNEKQEIVYTPSTKFLSGHSKSNKPGSVDEIKENYFVSCSGSYMKGEAALHAKQCVYREAK